MSLTASAPGVSSASEGVLGAFYGSLAMSASVGYQQGMQHLQMAAVGKVMKALTQLDAEETVSTMALLNSTDAAAEIAALTAELARLEKGPP